MSRSIPKQVNAGAPQGSVLGTYAFNIATDQLEEDAEDDHQDEEYELEEHDLDFLETPGEMAYAQSTPTRQNNPRPSTQLSPVPQAGDDFILSSLARNVPPSLTSRIEPTWRKRPINVRKFVDDNLQTEKLHMRSQNTFRQNGVTFKNPRVARSERMFRHIVRRAKSKGMLVNSAKTTLLAVSAANSYESRAHFYDEDNQRINNSLTLKALGFNFNAKGDVSTQVEDLCKKFRRKVWSLRHLRKSGFDEKELLRVYETYIRPTIEYSAPIYHPMLTCAQSTQIERLQFFALKNIYGFVYSQRELLSMSGLSTLEQRREQACLRFARKTAANPTFTSWFPKRRNNRVRNNQEHYVEMGARTERRRNSPIYYYRRLLNENRIPYNNKKI